MTEASQYAVLEIASQRESVTQIAIAANGRGHRRIRVMIMMARIGSQAATLQVHTTAYSIRPTHLRVEVCGPLFEEVEEEETNMSLNFLKENIFFVFLSSYLYLFSLRFKHKVEEVETEVCVVLLDICKRRDRRFVWRPRRICPQSTRCPSCCTSPCCIGSSLLYKNRGGWRGSPYSSTFF